MKLPAEPAPDLEAIALALCMTCPIGVRICRQGNAYTLSIWEGLITTNTIPDGAKPDMVLRNGVFRLIGACRELLGHTPTAREMWLIEAHIRRTIP